VTLSARRRGSYPLHRAALAAIGLACGVMLFGVFFPQRAANAATCGDSKWVGSKLLDQTHFGTRVTSPGMWVSNPSTSSNCFIVRSVYVLQDATHFAEFGWVIDPSGASTNCPAAPTPTVFIYSTVGSTIRCDNGETIASGDYDTSQWFRLENPNHDSYFSGYYQGIFEGRHLCQHQPRILVGNVRASQHCRLAVREVQRIAVLGKRWRVE
jgi:hypothetical protein